MADYHPSTLVAQLAGAGASLLDLAAPAGAMDGPALAAAAERLAGTLCQRGVMPGQVVAWPAANRQASVVAELACLLVGAISAPLPANVVDAPPVDVTHRLDLDEIAAVRAATLPKHHEFAADEPTTIKLTSGTTSRRRAVAATAGHCEHMARGVDSLFALDPTDTLLAILPGSVWLQRLVLQLALRKGARVVLLDQPERLARALRKVRPTIVLGVPRVLAAMQELAARAGRPLAAIWGGRLRSLWTGSAPLAPGVLQAYVAADIPLHEGYGMTETGMIAKNAPGRCRPGSVGRPFPGVHVEVRDGEVVVRCDYLASHGYTDGAPGRWIDERTYATGDLGHFDTDGYLYLEGRADDTLALATGHKVAPALVERALLASPMFDACVIVGHGRPWLAALVVAPGDETPAQLLAEARSRCSALAEHARVRGVIRIPPLDRVPGALTPAGKLDRQRLLAGFREELARLYGDAHKASYG
ncbi:AMP-binding protein [Haliangium ochraceum]|uniref:AMP-dependent synthetase and ligase n=1 Tax=Haliangium ochraceum (strain DSM 14365 / JCM 11303 / SMP-2) TaxID=502025 RepID=D0LRX8_HALO1|nr:AMP-binding protein [Haliangium ochraceum]ACY13675.1 AMP-dependent synthetase and ligase [Haliangium ochraceum DSM 14365]